MIFVDTGAWIALSDKSDQHHNEAVAIYQKLKRKKEYDSAVLSLKDCSSFAVCQLFGVHQAFAFDQHFTMMGISLCKK